VLARGSDPPEPPMACGPCDFVAGVLAALAQGEAAPEYPAGVADGAWPPA